MNEQYRLVRVYPSKFFLTSEPWSKWFVPLCRKEVMKTGVEMYYYNKQYAVFGKVKQALRRIWKLPYNCHTAILERLSGTITIFDTLCKRSMNFVQKCLHSKNVLVNFVSRHAVFYSRMLSGMGRNVQFYSERFGISLYDAIMMLLL